jgi:uncharacterized protein (UPF0261 family)
MDAGILSPPGIPVDVDQGQVARRGGKCLEELLAAGDKGACLFNMIRGGDFKGVLDLSLHEIGDRYAGGLHGAIREDRLEAAGEMGIPLQGYSFPDRHNLPHWNPEGNEAFVNALKADLEPQTPRVEVDAHINDPEFIDPVIEEFFSVMQTHR